MPEKKRNKYVKTHTSTTVWTQDLCECWATRSEAMWPEVERLHRNCEGHRFQSYVVPDLYFLGLLYKCLQFTQYIITVEISFSFYLSCFLSFFHAVLLTNAFYLCIFLSTFLSLFLLSYILHLIHNWLARCFMLWHLQKIDGYKSRLLKRNLACRGFLFNYSIYHLVTPKISDLSKHKTGLMRMWMNRDKTFLSDVLVISLK